MPQSSTNQFDPHGHGRDADRPIRVLAVSGSLRSASSNSAVVRAAAALPYDAVEVSVYRDLAELPPFNPDLHEDPVPAVARWRSALGACDAVLISSPEYAHGVPGVLKNALDWVVGSGEFIGKPVAIISASPHAVFAQASLTETLRVMSATLVPEACISVPVAGRKLDEHGILADAVLSTALRSAIGVLARVACAQRPRRAASRAAARNPGGPQAPSDDSEAGEPPEGINERLRAISPIQPAAERDPRMSDVNGHEGEGAWNVFEAEALPHVPRLFRLAMWLERNRSDAEDLVQETLMQALRSFHRFQPGTNCRAWLVTILYHVRSNRFRASSRLTLVHDEHHLIAETVPIAPPMPEGLTDEEILEALRAIPEAHQQIILLCDVEELTYREAAEALSIPIGTVMSRLHRGRALLREELAHMATMLGGRAGAAAAGTAQGRG